MVKPPATKKLLVTGRMKNQVGSCQKALNSDAGFVSVMETDPPQLGIGHYAHTCGEGRGNEQGVQSSSNRGDLFKTHEKSVSARSMPSYQHNRIELPYLDMDCLIGQNSHGGGCVPSGDCTFDPSGAFAQIPFDAACSFMKLAVVAIASLVAVAKVVTEQSEEGQTCFGSQFQRILSAVTWHLDGTSM